MQFLICGITIGVVILVDVLCFCRHTQMISYVTRAVPRSCTICKGQMNYSFLEIGEYKFYAIALPLACDSTSHAMGTFCD